jgi:hypothetical protein
MENQTLPEFLLVLGHDYWTCDGNCALRQGKGASRTGSVLESFQRLFLIIEHAE